MPASATDSPRPGRRVGVRELAPLLAGWQDRPGTPGYQALADRLRLLVLDGRLPVHAVLPSERALAAATGTSRTTTTAAYRALREAGFAAAGQGAGTWTALPHEPDQPAAAPSDPLPWPVTTTGRRGTADGRGDLSSAALEAPPQVHAAYVAALEDLPRFLPGHGYVTAGLDALRERVARRYTSLGLPTAPDEVLVVSGAVHGLRLVVGETLARGDRVLVESPTYPLALDVLRRAGARPVALPVEAGWDVAAFEQALRTTRARLAYLMPDFQNPTGALMPDDVRAGFADAAARHGCLVVVDGTTAELDLRAPGSVVPQPFGAGRGAAGVVHLGSTSKTFWGGLRVGWVRADRALVQRLTVARALDDLASPLVEQLATAHLLDRVDEVLGERRPLLAARCAALRSALAAALPDWEVPAPDGGLVAWCRLPAARSSAVAAAARDLGVTVTPGPRFGPDGGFEARLRVPFARPAGDLAAAAGLLAQAWRTAAGPGAARGRRPDDARTAPVL